MVDNLCDDIDGIGAKLQSTVMDPVGWGELWVLLCGLVQVVSPDWRWKGSGDRRPLWRVCCDIPLDLHTESSTMALPDKSDTDYCRGAHHIY